jgi:hypothetical protein
MRAVLLPGVVAAASILACSGATDPLSSVSAAVIPETVSRTVEPMSGRVDVSLRFSISNPTTDEIYYAQCSALLERKKGSEWESMASTICLAYASTNPLDRTQMIPPGGSGEVGAFLSGYGENGPTLSLPAGTYRVRFSVLSPVYAVWRGAMGSKYRSERLSTNEFDIEGMSD